MIVLKMAARNFLPFFNRIPKESFLICNSNAMHLGNKFIAAIFSAILNFHCHNYVLLNIVQLLLFLTRIRRTYLANKRFLSAISSHFIAAAPAAGGQPDYSAAWAAYYQQMYPGYQAGQQPPQQQQAPTQ